MIINKLPLWPKLRPRHVAAPSGPHVSDLWEPWLSPPILSPNLMPCVAISPRDEALLITRQRPKGLKVVSYPKFSIDSENPFLGGQSLRVLGEK